MEISTKKMMVIGAAGLGLATVIGVVVAKSVKAKAILVPSILPGGKMVTLSTVSLPEIPKNQRIATVMPVLAPGLPQFVHDAVDSAFRAGTLTVGQSAAVSAPWAGMYYSDDVILSPEAIKAGYTKSDYMPGGRQSDATGGLDAILSHNARMGNAPPVLYVKNYSSNAEANRILGEYMNNFVGSGAASEAAVRTLQDAQSATSKAAHLKQIAESSGTEADILAALNAQNEANMRAAAAKALNEAAAAGASTNGAIKTVKGLNEEALAIAKMLSELQKEIPTRAEIEQTIKDNVASGKALSDKELSDLVRVADFVLDKVVMTPTEKAAAEAASADNAAFIQELKERISELPLEIGGSTIQGDVMDTPAENLRDAGGVTDPETGVTAIGLEGNDPHWFDENGVLIM